MQQSSPSPAPWRQSQTLYVSPLYVQPQAQPSGQTLLHPSLRCSWGRCASSAGGKGWLGRWAPGAVLAAWPPPHWGSWASSLEGQEVIHFEAQK